MEPEKELRDQIPEPPREHEFPLEYFPEHLRRTLPNLHELTKVNGWSMAYEFGDKVGICFGSSHPFALFALADLTARAEGQNVTMRASAAPGWTIVSLTSAYDVGAAGPEPRNSAIRSLLEFIEQNREALAPSPKTFAPTTAERAMTLDAHRISGVSSMDEALRTLTPALSERIRANPPSWPLEFGGKIGLMISGPNHPSPEVLGILTQAAARFNVTLDCRDGPSGSLVEVSVPIPDSHGRKASIITVLDFTLRFEHLLFSHCSK